MEVEVRYINIFFSINILQRQHLVEGFLGIFDLVQVNISARKRQVERFVIRSEVNGVFEHLDGFAGIIMLAHKVTVPQHIFNIGWSDLHGGACCRETFILQISFHKRFCEGVAGGVVIRIGQNSFLQRCQADVRQPQGEGGLSGLELEVVIRTRRSRLRVIQKLEVVLVGGFVHAEGCLEICLQQSHVKQSIPFLLPFFHD